MRGLFNLSFRYKIPLWGSFLIVVTAAHFQKNFHSLILLSLTEEKVR